jgi:ankyrin repeat protein
MRGELHKCAATGNFERAEQMLEGGTDIEATNANGMTALFLASLNGRVELVVLLVEHGANVSHADSEGLTALHWACLKGNILCVKYLLEHGARITERDYEGKTALLHAAAQLHTAENKSLELFQFLLSSEGGASITETDNKGNTALLLSAAEICRPKMVQWLLEYGGAQINDTDNEGASVWAGNRRDSLPNLLRSAYKKGGDGNCWDIDIVALTALLRVIVLHGGPPESLTADLAPPFQQIVQDGARLRARLPAYLAQRQMFLSTHCLMLPPLAAIVHGYEEPMTTDELWATGLGASA